MGKIIKFTISLCLIFMFSVVLNSRNNSNEINNKNKSVTVNNVTNSSLTKNSDNTKDTNKTLNIINNFEEN